MSNKNIISNISYEMEENYNILPDDMYIWEGDLPDCFFNQFPDAYTKERASIYHTNDKLYNNDFNGVFDTFFQWNDCFKDLLSNLPISSTIANLPDFRSITEIWVSLFSTMPKITSNNKEITNKITQLLNNSNYKLKQDEIIRNTFFKYGNDIELITDKESFTYPVKCWIPFVSKNNPSKIEVNMLYNIGEINIEGLNYKCCEVSLYFENGLYEKRVYDYKNNYLGEELLPRIVEDRGFSPVIVFKGNSKDSYPFGCDSYKFWQAAISSCIQAYETILKLNAKLLEILRIVPMDAIQTNPESGASLYVNTGTFAYDMKMGKPDIEYKTPDIQMDKAIQAYNQTLLRLSRDTNLPYSIFDSKELGANTSAKALRTSMFLSQVMASKMASELKSQLKHYIYLLSLNNGIIINEEDFDITINTSFVKDEEEEFNVIMQRVGNVPTMTQAQAISILDGVSLEIAEEQVNQMNNTLYSESTTPDKSTLSKPFSENTFELSSGKPIKDKENTENTEGLKESVLGGENIGQYKEYI